MYFFIVNPHSCCGRGEKTWEKLEKILQKKAVVYECYLTQKPGDAREFARKLTESCREPKVIIIVGGDGTLNEVLDGLCLCQAITLGYVPAGSGNDFARSLRLPLNPYRCMNRILAQKSIRLLDYGVLTVGTKAEHRRFLVSSGLGLDAAVCQELLKKETRRSIRFLHLEKAAYLVLGLKQLLSAKPTKGYIILDRVKKIEFNHIYFISVHIHPFEGGGFQFAPQADSSDGKLSICVVSHENKWKLLSILASSFIKRKKYRKGIRTYECREAFLHVEGPMAVHADGESCGIWEDLQAECIEKKIRMIV
ncbi:MAG: diacylglycerol kinase family lipid kinase [Lachnospiraceae bacterium]|nr:diacylglycerol kinase family lipid kinase [Lachnospiraceae bacterium]